MRTDRGRRKEWTVSPGRVLGSPFLPELGSEAGAPYTFLSSSEEAGMVLVMKPIIHKEVLRLL